MDERLEAGRHHLSNGERALQQGYPSDARSHFEAALLQFRSPELRLGEAHALRGLAQVALSTGESTEAERLVGESISSYRALGALLLRIDEEGVASELCADAVQGEAASLVLLGDILVRLGRNDQAREALAYAREIYSGLQPTPSAAGVWSALGRLATREGHFGEASEALDRSMDIHDKSGDLEGKVGVLLAKAELGRLQEDLQGAERVLEDALSIAQSSRQPLLEGRVLVSLGSLLIKSSQLGRALTCYQQALPLVRSAGDLEMEARALLGLGEIESKLGDAVAVQRLLEGARVMARLNHVHGLAGALWRIGGHALRFGEPGLALVSGEAARRLWLETDPVHGVGTALRIVVKALAALKQWEAVLMAAMSRAAVAGELQPNALAVADFYKARAPGDLVGRLEKLEPQVLLQATGDRVADILFKDLAEVGMTPEALDSVYGALEIVSARVERLPQPAAPAEWENLEFGDADHGAGSTNVEATEADRPPTDEAPLPRRRSEQPPATLPLPGDDAGELDSEERDTDELPADSAGASRAPGPVSISGYEGLYDPPELDPLELDAHEELAEEATQDDELSVDDTSEIPAELQGAPPQGYDYASPFEE